MRIATRVALALTLAAPFPITLAACSSGDPAPAAKRTYSPPDAAVTVPPEAPGPSPVLVVIKGAGQVVNGDGTFECTPDAGADACTAALWDDTLYAAGYLPWKFDHWEPSMSTDTTIYLARWTGSPLTAVFVPTLNFDGGQH